MTITGHDEARSQHHGVRDGDALGRRLPGVDVERDVPHCEDGPPPVLAKETDRSQGAGLPSVLPVEPVFQSRSRFRYRISVR
jgi:hypothetical protein